MAVSSEQTAGTSSRRKSTAEHVKETLESIVVAFILAFVFRAFVVEAFVIPTGSMAATLYGAQVTHTCSNCGYEYAVGIGTPSGHQSRRSGSYGLEIHCPNCATQTDELKASEVKSPNSGDRILVHKWPFDVGGELLGPKRWDVVVFKDPRDGTTNFIKRLVGLPGEVLEIIDGDIYAAPIEVLQKEEPGLIREFEQLRRDVYGHGRRNGDVQKSDILPRYLQLNSRLLPHLTIQPKAAHAQRSLWFNVYDHDYLPVSGAEQSRARVRWQPEENAVGAWNTTEREITFESFGAETLYIQFRGKPLDDFYAYNNDGVRDDDSQARRVVGDLRLRLAWFPEAGNGGLTLELSRDRDSFVADLGVDGTVRVHGIHPDSDLPGHRQLIGEKRLEPLVRGRPTAIEFVNVDYRVSLLVNGKEVIASTPQQYAPSLEKLRWLTQAAVEDALQVVAAGVRPYRPSGVNPAVNARDLEESVVRIGGRNMRCRLRHVVLERDVYYRSQNQSETKSSPEQQGEASRPNPYFLRDREGNPAWPGWGTAGCPILLRGERVVDGMRYPGEYFMLGDNSPASKDSRLWWEIGPHLRHLGEEYQVGTVPGDQLIGKAFFVYWPAGYRPSWAAGIGLIPNVGRLRWIR